MNTTILF